MWTLLAKPGQLTLDFFAGRRGRYLPPIRLYFVISVALFALVPLLPNSDFARINTQVAGAVHDAEPQTDECVNFDLKSGDAAPPAWLQTFAQRLHPACEDVLKNGGHRIGSAMLHNHAFLFSALILNALLGYIPFMGSAATAVLGLYGLWYLYASMRRYYGQSARRTLAKYVALALVYGVLGVMLLTVTLTLSAISL
jgi:hypothetical protein